MTMLVECVPNVSEGRRLDVVDRLAAAAASVPGAHLLDRTSDASHNRSVFTLAGEVDAVSDALERLVASARSSRSTCARQTGEHPRIGAVDVIPFVPLGDTTLDDCVGFARDFGRRIAGRFDLPVYLYAAAAIAAGPGPAGRRAARPVRGAQGRDRDRRAASRTSGRRGCIRAAGATAVGARPFLIAWNINLDSTDLDLAKRIAHRVRESWGGLPAVQAKGFWIEELGCAQVSMNLLDFATTPIWRVWEAVAEEAAEDGVGAPRVRADRPGAAGRLPRRRRSRRRPATAGDEERVLAAGAFLRLRDASPLQALELRLRAVERAGGRRRGRRT